MRSVLRKCIMIVVATVCALGSIYGQGPKVTLEVEKEKMRVGQSSAVLLRVDGLTDEDFHDGVQTVLVLRITTPSVIAWTDTEAKAGSALLVIPIPREAASGGHFTRMLSVLAKRPGPFHVESHLEYRLTD